MRELSATVGNAPLLPLAPVRVRARRLIDGVVLSWTRRTRVDGDSWEAFEVPLGEDREHYRLAIRDGEVTKRVFEVAVPELLYGAADELADFGAPRSVLEIELAQVSLVAGAGASWRGSVTIR
jgi:hypothetical protein